MAKLVVTAKWKGAYLNTSPWAMLAGLRGVLGHSNLQCTVTSTQRMNSELVQIHFKHECLLQRSP